MESQKLVSEGLRALWPYTESAGAGRPGRDVLNTPGWALEVKARTGLDLPAWMKQATKEAEKTGDYAALVIRLNGQGPATLDEWPVVMTFGQWKDLVSEAGYGSAI